jgi:hypothetical protein
MKVYLGKDRQRATTDMTATYATVKQLTRKIQGCAQKLPMDNYFSSPDLYRDLTKQKINCFGTVRPNRKEMPDDFRSKTAKVWKDKRDVYMLTNIHNPPAEGNFCDESGNALKPAIVADYNRHMGYVDKGDRMANSYSSPYSGISIYRSCNIRFLIFTMRHLWSK